jgi:peptidoglycan/LPS O-acetylase OafA/YrhL
MPFTSFSTGSPKLKNRRELLWVLAFWLFSYVLLSIWGALVARDADVVIDGRRLIAVTVGAGLFALAQRSIRERAPVRLGQLIGAIAAASVAIFAVRFGLDQGMPDPRPIDRTLRWTLAWTGYFGIWILAAANRPWDVQRVRAQGKDLPALPKPYLEQLFDSRSDNPDEASRRS